MCTASRLSGRFPRQGLVQFLFSSAAIAAAQGQTFMSAVCGGAGTEGWIVFGEYVGFRATRVADRVVDNVVNKE